MEIRSENWWEAVDHYWAQLQNLIEKWHPSNLVGHTMEITAPGAEYACSVVRKTIRTQNPGEMAAAAREARDGATLHKIFNETWFGMPESVEVRSEPGFFALCDLCSEFEDYEYTV